MLINCQLDQKQLNIGNNYWSVTLTTPFKALQDDLGKWYLGCNLIGLSRRSKITPYKEELFFLKYYQNMSIFSRHIYFSLIYGHVSFSNPTQLN